MLEAGLRALWLSFFLLAMGCARERPPAPGDLDGMSHFLFKHWEDYNLLADGMGELGGWLEVEGRLEEATDFGFVLSELTAEEIVDTTHPDYPLDNMVGVALTYVSPFSIEEHGAAILREDQTYNSEDTYIQYDRTIREGTAAEFVPPEGLVRTDNLIDKSGALGIHIPFPLRKDFRWVVTDSDKKAIVGRSWVAVEGCSGDDGGGKNCVSLSFSIDLWYGSAENETIRLTSSWNFLQTTIDDLLTEDFMVKTMVKGLQDVFANTDALLAGE